MAEVLHGNVNDNQLNAGADKSQVYGLKGNDTLISDNKSDVLLVGGSGDDSLIMLGGTGTLSGGGGSDTFELNYSAEKKLSAVIEDLEPSKDKIVVKFDGEVKPQLTSVASGFDVTWEDGDGNFNVTIKGVRDNDYFDGEASEEAWKVLESTNAEREKQGLNPLTMSDGLTEGASIRAQEITALDEENKLNEYQHIRPNGDNYDTVFDEVGKHYSHYAENFTVGESTATLAVQDWMNSEIHRKNILTQNYLKLGVGYNYLDSSDHRWYWTQLFADSLNNPETVSATNLLTAKMENDTVSKFIKLAEGNNTLENSDYGATISGTAQADSINNTGLNVLISGGADNDSIDNSGSFVTIIGGAGDDQINLSNDAQENLIEYATGDGNDSISGLNSTDTLSISGSEFTPVTVGNNIIVAVGADSITLSDAVSSGVQIVGTRSKLLVGTEDADKLNNTDDAATILAKGGDDYIDNAGFNVLIDGAAGNDYIKNSGAEVSIDGASGNDSIDNRNSNVTIIGGAGDDEIWNEGNNVSIDSGDGDDTISNHSNNVTIDGDAGNDLIHNEGSNVTMLIGTGNDTIDGFNGTSTLKISGGSFSSLTIDDDLILINSSTTDSIKILNAATLSPINIVDENDRPVEVIDAQNIVGTERADNLSNNFDGATIRALGGDDTITNSGARVSISGGAGNDSIDNNGANVSIIGGAGDDQISNNQRRGTVYIYESGNDSIDGFNYSDSLNIGDYAWEPVESGNDILVNIINNNETVGSVTLKDYSDEVNILSTYEPPKVPGEEISNDEDSTIITGTAGDDIIYNGGDNVTINALAGNDTINTWGDNTGVIINAGTGNDYVHNNAFNSTIDTGDGNDSIGNWGSLTSGVSISSGAGNDSIDNNGSFVTIYSGSGNDSISNTGYFGDGNNVLINSGTGDDRVSNYRDTVTIDAGDGNDFIDNNGSQVSIDGGEGNDSIGNNGGANVSIDAGNGNDFIDNNGSQVSIDGGEGNDSIGNYTDGDSVTIEAGTGDDTIYIYGDNVSIDGGAGNDLIFNWGTNDVTINAGDDDDTIVNNSEKASIYGGVGNDSINNWGTNVTIEAGAGNNSIYNGGDDVSIDTGDGNDVIDNNGSNVTIEADAGNDTIRNFSDEGGENGEYDVINGGDGDDYIINSIPNSTILGGAGNDTIHNDASNVSIFGGTGDDQITLWEESKNNFIRYALGDGNDTVWGINTSDTLNFLADASLVSSIRSGEDIIFHVGQGEILLVGARNKPPHITYGESGSSGGGSSNGGNNGSGSSSGNGGNSGGSNSGGSNSTGGTSSSEGRGSDASGGQSAGSGSAVAGASTGVNSGSSGSSSSSRSGNDISRNAVSRTMTTSYFSSNQNYSAPATITSTTTTQSASVQNATALTNSASTSSETEQETFSTYDGPMEMVRATAQSSSNQHFYAGGNQVISNYQSGESIIFDEEYTSSTFDDKGTFLASSSTGVLAVQNTTDKFIDLADVNGNTAIEVYAATIPTIIDGRGRAGFKIFNGSDGPDEIYAGDANSQLWGGNGFVSDTLIGGAGKDIFIGGKNQGSDMFLNVSASDEVHLDDVRLSDLSGVKKDNDVITFSLKTGNEITIQSTDSVSGAIVLADSTWHFNHTT